MARTVVAGMAGNVMEWYDFALYGYFAPVIAKLFFPSDNHLVSLLSTFGVFAAGFLMRPLGGLIFGHLGDTIGRRRALAASVILMAVPTFLIGALPTYAQIGALAPVLLTGLRLLQGLSVGGEFTGSISFLVEHAPASRRGFAGSWTTFSANAGVLLGSGTGALITSDLSHDALYTWGWRVPFLLGIVVGAVGLYLRTGIAESPSFEALRQRGALATAPLREVVTAHRRTLLRGVGLSWLFGVAFYLIFVYMTTYLATILKQPLGVALTINTLSIGLMALLLPAVGALSDRIGRKPLLLAGALGLAVLAYPLFRLLAHDTYAYILAGDLAFAVLIALYFGPLPATMVEQWAARDRYSGLSIGYNLSLAVFGGTAPLIATFLIKETGNILSPSFYLAGAAVISLAVVLTLSETSRDPLR